MLIFKSSFTIIYAKIQMEEKGGLVKFKNRNHVCLVFDADDTLWFTSHKYYYPMIKCLNIIYHALGTYCPHPLKILQLCDELDRKSVLRNGFSKERFPMSWMKTYCEICKKYGFPPRKEVKKKLYRTAAGFWRPPHPLKDGCLKTLQELKRRGYYLVLLTMGDKTVQKNKIKRNKISRYFDEIKIVLKEKESTLRNLKERFDAENVWMIGNSPSSDIRAALRAGVKAIYVPWDTWGFDEWGCDWKAHRNFSGQINNLIELLEMFPDLNSK